MNEFDKLADLLADHQHDYDSDCGVDGGCSCGEIKDYDETDKTHAEHLAEVLTREGYHK